MKLKVVFALSLVQCVCFASNDNWYDHVTSKQEFKDFRLMMSWSSHLANIRTSKELEKDSKDWRLSVYKKSRAEGGVNSVYDEIGKAIVYCLHEKEGNFVENGKLFVPNFYKAVDVSQLTRSNFNAIFCTH